MSFIIICNNNNKSMWNMEYLTQQFKMFKRDDAPENLFIFD